MIESLISNIQKRGLLSFQSLFNKMINESSVLLSKNIKVLIEKGAFEEAYQCLLNKEKTDENSSLKANNNVVWHYLAQCSYEMGRLEEALEYIDLIIKNNYDTPKMWALKANINFEKDQEDDAIKCLNKAIIAFPNEIEANLQLGMFYLRKEEYLEAYNCFSGCCRIKSFDSFCWEMKAETLLKLNQPEHAGKCFARAIRCGGSIDLLARKAYCLAQIGQVKKAVRLYQKVLKYEPHNYDVLCNLAGIYGNQNKTEDAYTLLKRAYLLNCSDHVMLNNMGFILFRLGRYRKAIDYYNSALNMSPDNLEILYNLSVCLVKRALYNEAVTHLNRLVALQPNNSKAWMLLGNIYDEMEKHGIAVDCYNASYGLT